MALRGLVVVLLLYTAWAGVFVVRTSFLLDDQRHFVLFDDAMVSMAYARNLAEGRGLVWSPGGPPVEGFTNPLWTASMVVANLGPVPLRFRSLTVQIGGVLILGVVLVRMRSLLREHFAADRGEWVPAVVATGFQATLVYWTVLGMETALQALLAVLAVHFAYDIVLAGKARYLALSLVAAAAYLTRMDMLLVVVVVLAWVAANGGLRWRDRRRWLPGAGILVAAVFGYQLFRLAYFGEWLPNTYDLKLGGVPLDMRLSRGSAKLGLSLVENMPFWLLFLGAIVVALRTDRRRGVLLALLPLVYMAYSVWVGGDAWELPDVNMPYNRFVVFLLPLAFVLISAALVRWRRSAGPRRGAALVAAATIVLMLTSNGLVTSPRRSENWRRMVVADRPLFVESHALVLSNLRRLEDLVAPGAEVVTYWAGIPAFFSRYRLIDAQGYADAHVARRPLPAGLHWSTYVPGHMKRDPEYLLARRPDAFFQFWDLETLPVRWPRHHMKWLGYVQVGEYWLRRDSPYVDAGALSEIR